MQYSIGIESIVLMREAMPAVRAAALISSGGGRRDADAPSSGSAR